MHRFYLGGAICCCLAVLLTCQGACGQRDDTSEATSATEPSLTNHRRPLDDDELRRWLENMVWHHRFSRDEIQAATGLSIESINSALETFDISAQTRPKRSAEDALLVLPYPGGRHPRIGFLDGAIRPQRETKVSVFTPWDANSYVVLDIPEAIWSNLGLTYLAHTHIPTIFDQQNITLDRLEWVTDSDGRLRCERRLPNGIAFGTTVAPDKDAVRMEIWLYNGTNDTLSDLRVQNCAMLKGAVGFDQQTNDNKVFQAPYTACKSANGSRWIIHAWDPIHRPWGNERCPCLHADPKFPDCKPGQTQRVRGWFSFYQGTDIDAEFERIEQTGWRTSDVDSADKSILTGQIVDSDSNEPIPARVHIRDENGDWHFCRSLGGAAVHYDKQPKNMPGSVEVHTTLSADPFVVELPAGTYEFRIERGKEYLPVTQSIVVGDQNEPLTFSLQRWINMADRGWYSGDTHVHRLGKELANVLLAEDLNVAFPLNYWVTHSGVSPAQGDRFVDSSVRAGLIEVDPTHVIYPLNTEYEIFTVGGQRHTLGAVFVLNHKSKLQLGVPPVRPVAERARAEGALLDLDKHSWPWSLMLVPTMEVDLFELANNHVWQTEFGFRQWTQDTMPAYMNLETDDRGFTEWGWIDFGFQTYYALVNCGYRLRVSAGTASGVHPVQLGFGRVYVHLADGFDYREWVEGLDAGRSFVSTGPMLLVTFNEHDPGHTFQLDSGKTMDVVLSGEALSKRPLQRIELVSAGQVTRELPVANTRTVAGGYTNPIEATVPVDQSTWLAVRCFEQHPQNRVRFAHTNPVHIDIADKPLKPRKHEVEYLIRRMRQEIDRSRSVLDATALAEYRAALREFETIAESAD